MTLFRRVTLLAILIGAWGCQPTPYQKAYTDSARGYSDHEFSQDTFYVQFMANHITPAATLHRYLLRRAAELTVRHGFRYFAVIRDPGPRIEYHTEYRTREDEQAMIDSIQVEYPAWGTMHMTIQCFQDPQQAAGVRLIDAQAHLPKGGRPKHR